MAVYRERRRTNPFFIVIIALVVILLIIGAFLTLRNLMTGAGPVGSPEGARAKAMEAAQGLDIFTIEYPKEAQGQSSGAKGALSRAQSDFKSAESELAKINPDTVRQIDAAFTTLNQKVAAHAPASEVVPLAEQVKQQLLQLSKP